MLKHRLIAYFALAFFVHFWARPAQAKSTYQVAPYREVLTQFVSPKGVVNYKAMKKKEGSLARYMVYLARVSPAEYKRWTNTEKIAFWINAYNALTLKAILEHYPVSSIRKISGVWNKKTFQVMGQSMTLDHIEHQILRKQFNEPRIHMALVCASKSCPPLRNRPFTGKQLSQELNQQTQQFVRDPSKFKIEQAQKKVYLSSIFKWYGQDFVPYYKTTAYQGSQKQRASLKFLSGYLSPSQQKFLKTAQYRITYLSYDWSLNGF